MTDAIDVLCKECGFEDVLRRKKTETTLMVRYIIRTYEVFYGERSAPPIDIVKKALRIFLEIAPESVNLSLAKSPELQSKVLDRIVERIYKAAEAELIKDGTIKYIT